MKKGKIALIIAAALIIGGAGGYFLSGKLSGRHGEMKMEAKHASPEKTAQGEKGAAEKPSKTLYTCPMHPFIITEEPGACPICGMTLVPVKGGGEEKAEEENAIKISPVVKQNMGIRTGVVEEKPLVRLVRTYGRVTYDEKKISVVNTKVMGWIEKLYVNETGQFVKKGDPLLEIYSPGLVATEREYLIALEHREEVQGSPYREVVESAEKLLQAARERLLLWDIGEDEIAKLEKTRRVEKTLTITSPATGFVIAKNAFEGTHVKKGAELFRVADLSTLWVEGDVYEFELPWVRVGQDVDVTLDYIPGRTFHGKISYIYPYLEGKTRTARVRVEVENEGNVLKPDMYAHLTIHADLKKTSLVVPTEAVLRTGVRNIVFIEKGEGEFIPREVTLGVDLGDGLVEVASGLERGEKIVLSGQFMLDSESSIREAIRKMRSSGQESGAESTGHQGHAH
ncbi:MAG: efflux RND transporter periplasmic adaptor subunit [Deltaproteobacteria bacterium]|nr:MAG: efflux RND transporter periplasmic adaptor subunit [Deltaproteobacteria bacterium]